METQLEELRNIRDVLVVTGDTVAQPGVPEIGAFLIIDYGALEAFSTAVQADASIEVDGVIQRSVQEWADLRALMQTRAPFAYMDFLPTSAPGILMVGCPTYMVQLMGESVQWDMCDNLMDVFMVGTGRIVLIAFVTLFFVIGMVGRLAT